MEHTNQQLHEGQHQTKICEDLNVSRSLDIKVKKLLGDARTGKGREEAMGAEQSCHCHGSGQPSVKIRSKA
jgi:hypothetical protein